MRSRSIFLLGISFILFACSSVNYSEQAKLTLQDAEKNKKELKKAAKFLNKTDQNDKLDALIFLYENMPNHSYVKVGLFDKDSIEVNWNVNEFDSYDEAKTALEALEEEYGELNWGKKERKIDHQTVSLEFLLDNIDLAFKTWEEKPWSQSYDYPIFKEYILPYRGSNEPIESWRSWRGYFMDSFKDIHKDMFDKTDILEAAEIINNDLKSWFSFDSKYYLHPTDQGLFEMLMSKQGRCEDMSNLTIYAMRANGIAATSDYTPHWANSGNNHAWNVIVMPDGKAVPFMGCESDVGNYELSSKAAKVYRKVFSEQKDNLAFQIDEGKKVPNWLSGKCYKDVTKLYSRVSDVEVIIESNISDSTDFLYLCVFNSGEWKAIHWAKLTDNMAVFSDMGVDIAYLPMFYINEELSPAGDPFILTKNGDKKILNGSSDVNDLTLSAVTRQKRSQGSGSSSLENGATYELKYWDKGWTSIGKQQASRSPIKFTNVPQNSLYWLVKEDSDKEERIFTYKNQKQFWW